jgi:hypothetical protein
MTGGLTLIKKLWVKFDGMDIVCMCNENKRKCRDKDCKEYVVKFTEIKRKDKDLDKEVKDVVNAIKGLKKAETEVVKSMNKFRRLRIR